MGGNSVQSLIPISRNQSMVMMFSDIDLKIGFFFTGFITKLFDVVANTGLNQKEKCL